MGVGRIDRGLLVLRRLPSPLLVAQALADLFVLARVREGRASRRSPLLVFGQTAFSFYLAHILLLEVAAPPPPREGVARFPRRPPRASLGPP